MSEPKDRDSILAMKRHGPLARIAAWAGVVTAVATALSQVVPPVWDAVIGDDISQMQADLAQCQGDVKALTKLQQTAVRAIEVRIIESENETQTAVRLLAAEVRLRHGGDVDEDIIPERNARSRRARLESITEANDERVLSTEPRAARKRSGGLLEDMRRQGAPVQMIEGDR